MAARKRWNIQEVEVNEGMQGGGSEDKKSQRWLAS